MGTDWDARMNRAAELSDNPHQDRFETMEREPHLRYGEGAPDDLDTNSLPVDTHEVVTRAAEISSESARRWPALRSAQEAARGDIAVPAKEAPGEQAQPDTSEGEV